MDNFWKMVRSNFLKVKSTLSALWNWQTYIDFISSPLGIGLGIGVAVILVGLLIINRKKVLNFVDSLFHEVIHWVTLPDGIFFQYMDLYIVD